MTDVARSDRPRYVDAELERLLLNWQRWKCGDPSEQNEVSIESGLNPDRMTITGQSYDRYRETKVPALMGDALTVQEAIYGDGRGVSGIPKEFQQCLSMEYLEHPEWTDERRAHALGYGSRQTYYRRLDDAKIMVRTKIYGQRRRVEKARAEYAVHAEFDNVDTKG